MEQSSVASTRVRVSACSVFRKFGLKSDALIGIVNQQIDRVCGLIDVTLF